MCFLKSWKFCHCSPPVEPSIDYKISPIRRSPVDRIGYKAKCCGCVPLKYAAIVIGIMTLMWSMLQIQSADKVVSDFFTDKEDVLFQCAKIFYILIATILMFSSGLLFFGIAMSNYLMIHIFVWYAFLYNCFSITCNVMSFVWKLLKEEKKIMKHIIKVMMSLSWNCFYFYLLVIVNSFKITTLWS